jgi:multimeric flavodoxin WrbA
MNLLIISGTPKTEGVTYSFVEKAKKTADELGIEAEVLRLSCKNLSKCRMCDDGWGVCFYEHTCKFGDADGFNELQKKVQNADAFIYLTPVYWGEISEELKIFMDKLRRCQATKQWDSRENEVSFHKGKPSILVAVAGGGGGGCSSTFADLERAISQMSGDEWPREYAGIFDYIAVNRWNQEYKREALKSAITTMYDYFKRPKATDVTIQPDYHLLITFDNDEKRLLDFRPYIETKSYNILKDLDLFSKAKIAGTKIEWQPLLDVDVNLIYLESICQ